MPRLPGSNADWGAEVDLKALRAAAGARAPNDPPPDMEPPIAKTPPVFESMLNNLKRRIRNPAEQTQAWPHTGEAKAGPPSRLKQIAIGAAAALSCIVVLGVYRTMTAPPPSAAQPAPTAVPPELVVVELKPGQNVLLRGRLEPSADEAATDAPPAP
jgi:hypothetical protein